MPVLRFSVPGHATRREFAIYAVVAKNIATGVWKVYVGKTGDNRSGCNPVISRAGNHFSYNEIHSQVRSKLAPSMPHEFDFEYFYVTFDSYLSEDQYVRNKIDVINEMERTANIAIYNALPEHMRGRLLNPFRGAGHVKVQDRQRRAALRTPERQAKVQALAQAVAEYLAPQNDG